MNLYAFLADLVVVIHGGYVLFVLLGMAAIVIGWFPKWRWVRNFWFRVLHLAAIGFVCLETVADITCPLTNLEDDLRTKAGEAAYAGDFIGHWVHELLFFDLPDWAFALIYMLFGLAVVGAFVLVPPTWPRRLQGCCSR